MWQRTHMFSMHEPMENVALYAASVSTNWRKFPLLNSILVQSTKSVFDFPLNWPIDDRNSPQSWLHRSIGLKRSSVIEASLATLGSYFETSDNIVSSAVRWVSVSLASAYSLCTIASWAWYCLIAACIDRVDIIQVFIIASNDVATLSASMFN